MLDHTDTRTERSGGPADTERLAAELAAGLSAGDVVLVEGELGAGKTTFVRGACRALGIEGPITSPTFTIGRLYGREGAPSIAHLDLYRLDSLAAEEPGMLEDYVNPETISFVEWPAVAAAELERIRLQVKLEHLGGDSRRITIGRPR